MIHDLDLACGRLRLRVRRSALPLEELLSFASRRNPRRGFLFVSKVLGRHLPVRPSRMRAIHDLLACEVAERADRNGPILVVGLAETATGLGAGVADSLARLGLRSVLSQHTTRHALGVPVLLRFDEAHSHAPDHILHAPSADLAGDYFRARTLVLVDDEITSGRTLGLLAGALAVHLPALQHVILASLVNWMPADRTQALARVLSVPLSSCSLLEGVFSFEPDPSFQVEMPASVLAVRAPSRPIRADMGRRALRCVSVPSATVTLPEGSWTVVGTGEFAHQPFLLAEALERQGRDVLFQCTTRSPIMAGGAIQASVACRDELGEGVANYLHNPPASDRSVLVCYEDPEADEDLAQQLGARTWHAPPSPETAIA